MYHQRFAAVWKGLAAIGWAGVALAFDAPVATEGPLTLELNGPAEISDWAARVPLEVVLRNGGDAPITGAVQVTGIDAWRCEPEPEVRFEVSPSAETRLPFEVTPAEGSFNAHYPIHARARFQDGAAQREVHAVLIIKTQSARIPQAEKSVAWQTLPLQPGRELSLWNAPMHRTIIQTFSDGAVLVMPVAWEGAEESTRGSLAMDQRINRGRTLPAIGMHPAWYNGRAGTILVEFPVKLPETPVQISFATAIRDTNAAQNEPPSDGVTFRVRAAMADAPDGQLGDILWEGHSDSKAWEDATADLGAFSGKSIRLQLETHPGPKNDTTCDQAYWGAPRLMSVAAEADQSEGASAQPVCELGTVRHHGESYSLCVRPGSRGLLDGEFTIAGADARLAFRGIEVRVFGDLLHAGYSFHRLTRFTRGPAGSGRDKWVHYFEGPYGPFDIAMEFWAEQGAFRMHVAIENAPDPRPWQAAWIEDLALGPWTETADRVYAGAGNVLVEPEAFELPFDGHQLATSFAGFEFANGLGLVQAVDTPPLRLDVSPQERRYTLRAEHNTTMYLIPASNVWLGARTWRRVNGLHAAAGVEKLAGRFVFDIWGGHYAPAAASLRHAFLYGLTDAAVVWHNWQRWGYDYRLPDIFPPNPNLGTHDEFRQLVQACHENGVLFAQHDNYIDLYPDASAFSYERVAFTADRRPVPAWLNGGRGAQSYRWRTDSVRPYLERNIACFRADFAPSAYFIDVWSSIRPYDYWSSTGAFYDCLYTRDTWGRFFEYIRTTLGNNAPQISESGHDQLIGYLDGAQANHLRVEAEPEGADSWFVWRVHCKDSERIPWFDMAHHDRFVLHGAGYDPRYRAGLDPGLHGIYSDDYLATEVLTGHPAMVDAPFGRNVVRKYWLLHGIMRAIAARAMEWTGFVDEDIHRQYVRWEGGGQTWVNRSETDWQGKSRTIPQYGFYANIPSREGTWEACIERIDGVPVEWSRGPAHYYVNARPAASSGTDLDRRMNTERKMIDFGAVSANGGCRLQPRDESLVVTPLPESEAFTLNVVWTELSWDLPVPSRAEAFDETGGKTADLVLGSGADGVLLEVPAGVFEVRITP